MKTQAFRWGAGLLRTTNTLLHGGLVAFFLSPAGLGLPDARAEEAPPPVQEPTAEADTPSITQTLTDFLEGLQVARDALPAENFDPTALVRQLGDDPVDLLEWVRQHITWVPYEGHLRSPETVLIDRTANSLDRALFLARLLQLAGHTPLLARADPGADWINKHVAGDGAAPLRPLHLPEVPEVPAEITDPGQRETIQRFLHRREKTLEQLAARAARQAPILKSWFKEFQQPPLPLETPEVHWWVALASEESDTPLVLDPAGAPHIDADDTFPPEDLPAELIHTVEIAFLVEQATADGLEEKTALRHRLPAAKLNNGSLRIGVQALDMDVSLASTLEQPEKLKTALLEAAEDASDWTPYLSVAGEWVMDHSFDAQGNLHRKHESTATSAALGSALRGLGGLGAAAPAKNDQALSAVHVEYTSRGPGRPPITERRTMYHRGVAQNPDENVSQTLSPLDLAGRQRRGLALLHETTLLVQTGLLTQNALTARHIDHLLAGRPALLGSAYYYEKGDLNRLDQSLARLEPFPSDLYRFTLLRFMLHPQQTELYLDQPNLIAWHQSLQPAGPEQVISHKGYDLIANPVQTRTPDDRAATLRLDQAVLDAALESVLLTNESQPAPGTSGLLQRLPPAEWITLRGVDDLSSLPTPPPALLRERMRSALEAGSVLVVPRTLADLDPEEASWWEFNPRTGHALGRLGTSAWGGSASEYMINLYVAKAAIFALALGISQCSENPTYGCVICSVLGGALIAVGVFGPDTWAAYVVVTNMLVSLGCGITS